MSCRAQALDLLKRGWPPGDSARYDPDHALVLCRMHAFTPGLLFLYEQLRLFREVLHVRSHLGVQPIQRAGFLSCRQLLGMRRPGHLRTVSVICSADVGASVHLQPACIKILATPGGDQDSRGLWKPRKQRLC